MDQIQMKVKDADYNVRMRYWASRNNVQEYKVYAMDVQPNFCEQLATSS
jgi:hypothetical protein